MNDKNNSGNRTKREREYECGFKLKYSHLILIYILPNPGDKASRAAFPGNEEKSA
jgi:hypothetical protein